MCGELWLAHRRWAGDGGSSPRVRGTRIRYSCGSEYPRFIPACAGNSRVCQWIECHCTGSSPRVRGTRAAGLDRQFRVRFIPACAGNSWTSWTTSMSSTVHPRVCGELVAVTDTGASRCGSSPRVRGTPRCRRLLWESGRFIPACAGNSSLSCPPLSIVSGSSPRVRGTRPQQAQDSESERFIPACAGNSGFLSLLILEPPVHPRVCGELVRLVDVNMRTFGSSPRVRGTQPTLPGMAVELAVHPRVCGELHVLSSLTLAVSGSSPRVRGTPGNKSQVDVRVRFIPACAGNSLVVRPQPARGRGSSPRVRGTR